MRTSNLASFFLATSVIWFATTQNLQAFNAVEKIIVALEPCKSIPQLDRFRDLKLGDTSMAITKNIATLNSTVALSCKTSDSTIIRLNMGATFQLAVVLDLNTCAVTQSNVTITDTSGDLSGLILGAREEITNKLENQISISATKWCLEQG